MGLDLYHKKAVAAPVDPRNYYYAEDFPPEALAEYGFGRYLQEVPSSRERHCALFFEDEASLEYERARRANEEGAAAQSYWIGTPEANDDALLNLERRLNLDRRDMNRADYTVMRERQKYRLTSLWYDEPSTAPGIYYVDVGYQRKGMVSGFYDYFRGKGSDFFVREEHFRVLEGFLDPGCRDELLPNLRANFLDNYERGRSFLYVSS